MENMRLINDWKIMKIININEIILTVKIYHFSAKTVTISTFSVVGRGGNK